MTLFIEVENPTDRNVIVSQFDYGFAQPSWLPAKARITVDRQIPARGSAILDITVPMPSERPPENTKSSFSLHGNLHVRDEMRSQVWPVSARGQVDWSRDAGG